MEDMLQITYKEHAKEWSVRSLRGASMGAFVPKVVEELLFLLLLVLSLGVIESFELASTSRMVMASTAISFQHPRLLGKGIISSTSSSSSPSITSRSTTTLSSSSSPSKSSIQEFLTNQYPMFMRYVLVGVNNKNDELWKKLQQAVYDNGGCTIFVMSDSTFASVVSEKAMLQLMDDRNTETAQKIASYHCVNEMVTAEQLYDSSGIVTFGGIIPIERTIVGGIFGTPLGGKEDGTVTISGTAKIENSYIVGNQYVIHEVNGLVSPKILWRYMDQLRIPGSK